MQNSLKTLIFWYCKGAEDAKISILILIAESCPRFAYFAEACADQDKDLALRAITKYISFPKSYMDYLIRKTFSEGMILIDFQRLRENQ